MMKTLTVLAVVAATGSAAMADAVEAQYTVSGSSGAWVLDFQVTNNMNPGDMGVYLFGVYFDTGRNIAGSPAVYDPDIFTSWNNFNYGGSNTEYNNVWIDQTTSVGPYPGQTLSGFQATYTGANYPSEVQYFAFGYSISGGEYDGSQGGFFNFNPNNPGVEGFATEVPAPASLAPLGMGGLAAARRHR